MPKVAGRAVRGEFLALQLFEVDKSVTPKEINAHVGRGDYAAKYISFLKNRHGFTFTVQKDGREVVSYTLAAEPANAAEVRAKATEVAPAKVAKVKVPKVKAEKKTKTKVRKSKQTAPAAKAARTVLKDKADQVADALLAEIGMKNAGEYAGGTYSVDPDWDSMDGIDVANFLK